MCLHSPKYFFRLANLILMMLFAVVCGTASAPEPPVDAFTMNQKLGRTVNLANALEAPNEGDWGLVLQKEYFQLVKEAGFTAVRIPIRWNAHAMPSTPYTIAPEFFKRIDWAVEQALSHRLVV